MSDRMRTVRAVGNRIIVLPDRNDRTEVGGHEYDVDQGSGLVLGKVEHKNTGIVLSVGHLVDEPELVRLREEMERARETGEPVRTVRVLWIRDLSLVTTLDGVEYACLAVPTRQEWREARDHRVLRDRNREQVLAVLPDDVWVTVQSDSNSAEW